MKSAHTNLIARDWRALADFYIAHLGCQEVPPERDYAGATLEAGTGIRGSTLRGVHLRLPGGACSAASPGGARRLRADATSRSRGRGARFSPRAGGRLGRSSRSRRQQANADPEGNIIELQSWA